MKAKLNYLKIAPRKVRLIVDQIRGTKVDEALLQLSYLPQRSASSLRKLVKSAADNARNIYKDLEDKDLIIQSIYVNEGPVYRRYRARAYGRAAPIRRKTSRVVVELKQTKGTRSKVQRKKQEAEIKTVNADQVDKSKKGEGQQTKRKDSDGKNKGQGNFVKKIFRRKAI